jgi:hypothetical protein
MTIRTVTGSIESDASPDTVLEFLADPRNIPQWAPAFADNVEQNAQEEWQVTKDDSSFSLQVIVERSARTVDYLREIAPGRRGGAYIRVLPRPNIGSVVVMTLPIPADGAVDSALAIVNQELRELVNRIEVRPET